MHKKHSLPESGYLRLSQIIGCKKNGHEAIIPISRSSWLAGVKNGRFPKPTKAFGKRITAWSVSDIRNLLDSAAEGEK